MEYLNTTNNWVLIGLNQNGVPDEYVLDIDYRFEKLYGDRDEPNFVKKCIVLYYCCGMINEIHLHIMYLYTTVYLRNYDININRDQEFTDYIQRMTNGGFDLTTAKGTFPYYKIKHVLVDYGLYHANSNDHKDTFSYIFTNEFRVIVTNMHFSRLFTPILHIRDDTRIKDYCEGNYVSMEALRSATGVFPNPRGESTRKGMSGYYNHDDLIIMYYPEDD